MILFILFCISCTFVYAFLILFVRRKWLRLPDFGIFKKFEAHLQVSIVVSARNEESNINALLESINGLVYPRDRIELILVDDFSEDKTALRFLEFSHNMNHSLIRLNELPDFNAQTPNKKRGIELGVEHSKGEIILVTDSDCHLPKEWALWHAFYHEHLGKDLVAGAVLTPFKQNIISGFQTLDYLATMVFTAVGMRTKLFYSANGANLSFKRRFFQEIGGYTGNDHIHSGDDLFLIQAAALRIPDQIGFINSPGAMVLTNPLNNWTDLFQQRLRWGSKIRAFTHSGTKRLMAFFLIFHVSMGTVFILAVIFGSGVLGLAGVAMLAVKLLMDYILLRPAAKYFSLDQVLKAYLVSGIVHVCYIIATGLSSLFNRTYTWKDRSVSMR